MNTMKIFRSSLALYLFMAIGGIVAFLAAGTFNEIPGPESTNWQSILAYLFSLTFVILWILASGIVAMTYANRKMKRIFKLLLTDCDPEAYSAATEKIFRKRDLGYLNIWVGLSRSLGHFAAGDYDKAKQCLDGIVAAKKATVIHDSYVNKPNAEEIISGVAWTFPDNAVGTDWKATYYNDLAFYFIQTGDLAGAEDYLVKLKKVIDNPKMKDDAHGLHYASYTNMVFMIRAARGNYEGAEEVFRIALNRNRYLYYKLGCQLALAKVYIHNQKPDMAREALEFIIGNGKKLYLVDEAKALLEGLK